MNEASSRSHAVLTISVVEQQNSLNTDKVLKKSCKIHIVDLAGSERADTTGASGQRLKEGSAINQSLSALGNVINALSAKERGHVPYRDSKLTYLLSDSLGGNSLTLMIACLSPAAFNYEESISTLRFAERAKNIVNNAKINMDPLMMKIIELENEILLLKSILKNCSCSAAKTILEKEKSIKPSVWTKIKTYLNKIMPKPKIAIKTSTTSIGRQRAATVS
jgi:hypothetical protein